MTDKHYHRSYHKYDVRVALDDSELVSMMNTTISSLN
jgi:hypothetical protein